MYDKLFQYYVNGNIKIFFFFFKINNDIYYYKRDTSLLHCGYCLDDKLVKAFRSLEFSVERAWSVHERLTVKANKLSHMFAFANSNRPLSEIFCTSISFETENVSLETTEDLQTSFRTYINVLSKIGKKFTGKKHWRICWIVHVAAE